MQKAMGVIDHSDRLGAMAGLGAGMPYDGSALRDYARGLPSSELISQLQGTVDISKFKAEIEINRNLLRQADQIKALTASSAFAREIDSVKDAVRAYEEMFRLPAHHELHALASGAIGQASLALGAFGTTANLEAALDAVRSP